MFFAFCFVCGLAFWEFFRFTRGWAGLKERTDNGEGFDREQTLGGPPLLSGVKTGWRNSRLYRILIVFVITSLVRLHLASLPVLTIIVSIFHYQRSASARLCGLQTGGR